MKNIFFLLPFFLFTNLCIGQQTVQYSQYLFNAYALNPAVAGSKECLDVRMGYRTQWSGFDGAPKTYFASITRDIGRNEQKFSGGWHGIGVYIEQDITGPYNVKGFYPSYAYHKRFSGKYVIALGFFIGFRQHTYEGSKTQDFIADPILAPQQLATVFPDISPGLWFYSNKFYAGLSAKQVYKTKISDKNNKVGSPSLLKPHFYFSMGSIKETKANITYHPSIHIRYTLLYPPSIDISLLVLFGSRLGLGLSYRNTDALVTILQVRLSRTLKVGYSFDYITSAIRHGGANSHEIILGFTLCPKADIKVRKSNDCPAYK